MSYDPVTDPTSIGNILKAYGVTSLDIRAALEALEGEQKMLEEALRQHKDRRLGQKLVEMNVIAPSTLQKALDQQNSLRKNTRAASRSVCELLQSVTKKVKASGDRSLELSHKLAEA